MVFEVVEGGSFGYDFVSIFLFYMYSIEKLVNFCCCINFNVIFYIELFYVLKIVLKFDVYKFFIFFLVLYL